MPKIKYLARKFGAASLALIDTCNRVIQEYTDQGFVLTLRQLIINLSRGTLSRTGKKSTNAWAQL